jgi:uncharacterized membrane protein YphA (DoxX/SURF4 family)
MSLAYDIAGIVLALMLLVSAYTKLTRNQQLVDGLTGLGVPVGIAAAIGLVLYFVGAVEPTCARAITRARPALRVCFLPRLPC